MSITSTYPVRFRLLKHVIREEGYIFRREAKRRHVGDFLRGRTTHIPFKFRVPGQAVSRITRGEYRPGYIRIGCQEFIGEDARLLREWALIGICKEESRVSSPQLGR
jgi:hypothetical protein